MENTPPAVSEHDMKAQLKEFASNYMFRTRLFPNLSKMCRCNLSLNPCHDSFSRKKLCSNKANYDMLKKYFE